MLACAAALALLAAPPLRAAELRLLAVDASTTTAQLSGYDVVSVLASADDGSVGLRAQQAGLARVERGLGPGPGAALFTRLPIEDKALIQFSCRPYGAVYARLRTAAGPLDVYRVRFAPDRPDEACRERRLAQAFQLAEQIERRSEGRPLLVLGRSPGPGDAAFAALADLLGLSDVAAGRAFARSGARAAVKPAAGGLEARLELKTLAVKAKVDAAKRAEALRRVAASLDRQIAGTYDSERWAWVPVWGLAVVTRNGRLRDELLAIRTRADTARILELEKR